MGIVENQVAQFTRARWRLGARPEQFSCLESADPRVQLQEALTQIENLLHENTQLLQNVLLLSQALNDAHSLIQPDKSLARPNPHKMRQLEGSTPDRPAPIRHAAR